MKWPAAVIIGLAIGGLSLSGAKWPDRPPLQAPSNFRPRQVDTGTPDIRVQDMHLIAQTETTTAWEVLAKEAIFSDTQQRVVVKQVKAQLHLRAIDPMRMTAERGQIDGTTGDIAVEGHVRLQPRKGYTIETEVLYWRAVEQTLYTDAPVRIRNPVVSITGTGLYSNVEQHRFILQHGVRASFRFRENP